MTRQEMRVFLQDWFCGCGNPEEACRALHDLLVLHPLYENQEALRRLLPNEGSRQFMLYILDAMGLTEHGTSVNGAWLSDKGQAVLAALRIEADDEWNSLIEPSCIHGYAIDSELDNCPACSADIPHG